MWISDTFLIAARIKFKKEEVRDTDYTARYLKASWFLMLRFLNKGVVNTEYCFVGSLG